MVAAGQSLPLCASSWLSCLTPLSVSGAASGGSVSGSANLAQCCCGCCLMGSGEDFTALALASSVPVGANISQGVGNESSSDASSDEASACLPASENANTREVNSLKKNSPKALFGHLMVSFVPTPAVAASPEGSPAKPDSLAVTELCFQRISYSVLIQARGADGDEADAPAEDEERGDRQGPATSGATLAKQDEPQDVSRRPAGVGCGEAVWGWALRHHAAPAESGDGAGAHPALPGPGEPTKPVEASHTEAAGAAPQVPTKGAKTKGHAQPRRHRLVERPILKEVSGCARVGELTAIVGPSGCGKTTLLDVLAARIEAGGAGADKDACCGAVQKGQAAPREEEGTLGAEAQGPPGVGDESGAGEAGIGGAVGHRRQRHRGWLWGAPREGRRLRAPRGFRGAVLLDGRPADPAWMRRHSAYVMQDDLLFAALTVRETLMFAAELKLPREMPRKEKRRRVEGLLELLGLRRAADTLIGDHDLRGVSGGERKRAAIGVSIVHGPALLFLDEPTTGLDSLNSLRVAAILKGIAAHTRAIVVAVLHQPSFRVLGLIDRLLLLSHGHRLFFAPPAQLPPFLASCGLPVPRHANVCEFALEQLAAWRPGDSQFSHVEALGQLWGEGEGEGEADRAVQAEEAVEPPNKGVEGALPIGAPGSPATPLAAAGAGLLSAEETGGVQEALLAGAALQSRVDMARWPAALHRRYANTWVMETLLLTWRAAAIIFRTPGLYFTRLLLLMLAGLMLASLFWRPAQSLTGVLELSAFLSFFTALLFFCSADATPIFIQERNIFIREALHNTYRPSSYVVASCLVYVPLFLLISLGITLEAWWCVGLAGGAEGFFYLFCLAFLCLFTGNALATLFSAFMKNIILAYSIVISVMAYFLLLSGFYIRRTSIPSFWLWLHYISPLKYAYEGIVQNEFVRYPATCFLTLQQLLATAPIADYIDSRKALAALGSLRPSSTASLPALTATSCLIPSNIVPQYLGADQLPKWACLGVVLTIALLIRFAYFCSLTVILTSRRR